MIHFYFHPIPVFPPEAGGPAHCPGLIFLAVRFWRAGKTATLTTKVETSSFDRSARGMGLWPQPPLHAKMQISKSKNQELKMPPHYPKNGGQVKHKPSPRFNLIDPRILNPASSAGLASNDFLYIKPANELGVRNLC